MTARRSILRLAFALALWTSVAVSAAMPTASAQDKAAGKRPNIVWIVVEDASPHIGCYGETTIETPHIDALSESGVRFTNAIVTSPVCSPSRSAMVTGMYQTTLGAHNHRSQTAGGKGGGNQAYFASYKLPVKSVPELLRETGYYVTNTGLNKSGKTDYNFIAGRWYEPGDWKGRQPGQPFFAQIQLHGGKARGARVDQPVDPADVALPPYYAEHPVIRRDWAAYLNSWIKTDNEVGQIVARLKKEGVLDNTIVFFWTDHGVSHLRGKQFLYDEGVLVPLIVGFGDGRFGGTERDDPVEHIDVAAASLSLAGIEVPDSIQGRNLFGDDYRRRDYSFSARDRCDETVDIIRCVRTGRFKYIRNFMSHLPHAQPNQYKDGKAIVRIMRQLHAQGKLNRLQARPFEKPRPTEELYDLQADPFETRNLAGQPKYRQQLERLRGALYDWMVESRDLGLIPEPILENLGRKYGTKYHVLKHDDNRGLVRDLIAVIEAGQRGDRKQLREALASERPSLRYWAATWLGNLRQPSATQALTALTQDDSPAVRIAAALALCKLGRHEDYLPLLAEHIQEDNLLAGMFAIRALEQIGPPARAVLPAIEQAKNSRYEFTRRFARRLSSTLGQ